MSIVNTIISTARRKTLRTDRLTWSCSPMADGCLGLVSFFVSGIDLPNPKLKIHLPSTQNNNTKYTNYSPERLVHTKERKRKKERRESKERES